MAYEKKLGRYLAKLVKSDILSGDLFLKHWIQFQDSNGPGWAQPDFFLVQPHQVIIFEAKLTQTEEAVRQLEGLYRPLLEHCFARPAVTVQVCKNLVRTEKRLIRSFSEIANRTTLHWLGV